jgi:hypothetical protein
MMLRLALLLLLITSTLQPAFAQEQHLRPLVGMGLTGGGDKLSTVSYADGSTQSIHAGGLVHFYVGLRYEPGTKTAITTTFGYHVDQAYARNGDMKFQRFPLELIAQYEVADRIWLGAGGRYISSAKITGSGFASGVDYNFGSTSGVIVQGSYLISNHYDISVRYVKEEYSVPGSKIDGSHGGIYFAYIF